MFRFPGEIAPRHMAAGHSLFVLPREGQSAHLPAYHRILGKMDPSHQHATAGRGAPPFWLASFPSVAAGDSYIILHGKTRRTCPCTKKCADRLAF